MSFKNNTPGGYFFTMDQAQVIKMAGYNKGFVQSSTPIIQTPPDRPRFGWMLQLAFAYGTIIPEEEEWPDIYDNDDNVIGSGIPMVNMSNDDIFKQACYIYNSEFAQIVGFQPGSVEVVNSSRLVARKMLKYLNLLYMVPVFFSGDPVLPVAERMAQISPFEIRDNYPKAGFPGVLNIEDVDNIIRHFLKTEDERRAFVFNYLHRELRLRGNPNTLEKKRLDYLIVDDNSGITL